MHCVIKVHNFFHSIGANSQKYDTQRNDIHHHDNFRLDWMCLPVKNASLLHCNNKIAQFFIELGFNMMLQHSEE
jgi:hypothetical protein